MEDGRRKEASGYCGAGRCVSERGRGSVHRASQRGPGSEPQQQHGVSGFGVRQCRHRERGWGDLFRHARRRPSRESH